MTREEYWAGYDFIRMQTGAVLREVGQHLHGNNAARVEVAEVVTAIKRRAEETVEDCTSRKRVSTISHRIADT